MEDFTHEAFTVMPEGRRNIHEIYCSSADHQR